MATRWQWRRLQLRSAKIKAGQAARWERKRQELLDAAKRDEKGRFAEK